MEITKRAVLYIGYKCNLNCKFCYYHFMSERHWEKFSKMKFKAWIYKNIFGNDRVDITGGEPTIYPQILELVRFCKKIGLRPSIITNGIALADEKKVLELKNAGVFDFIISVHGLGKTYDEIVDCKGSSKLQEKGIQNLVRNNIPFRINVTLTKYNTKQLPKIAEYASKIGARVVNFICFNPFEEWDNLKQIEFQEKHSEITNNLKKAIEILDKKGIESNVRYFPFCMLKGFEKYQYNLKQLSYDTHEWDFMSWHKNLKYIRPFLLKKFFGIKQDTRKHYLEQSLIFAKVMGYVKTEKCKRCSLKQICNGLSKQYYCRFGDSELKSYEGELIKEPTFFIKNQFKIKD